MTENDKKALLRDINTTARMIDYFRKQRKEIAEILLQLENKEEISNAIELQLKIQTLINTLHDLIHVYINEATSEGYEIKWDGYKAIDLFKNLCDTNPFNDPRFGG